MKHQLEHYKKIKEDLIKQVELCHLYKDKINETLKEFKNEYESGLVDKNTYILKTNKFLERRSLQNWYSMYDDHISKCYDRIKYYEEKINEFSEKHYDKISSFSKAFMLVGIVALIFSVIFLLRPTITGLVPYGQEYNVVFEDGYTKEGSQWMEIKGSRLYERCLQVKSEVGFDSINIIAKVTSATDKKDLTFSLYNNDKDDDGPSELIKSCEVNKYNELWKSCRLDNLDEKDGTYWVCVSSPGGDSNTTYYTIAYQNGDSRKTALWTGENWQKLDRASYTIKAQFLENDTPRPKGRGIQFMKTKLKALSDTQISSHLGFV